MKSVTAAIVSAAIVIASTNLALGQGNPPAASGNENGAASTTAPSSGEAAGTRAGATHAPRKVMRPHHKKKQSFGNRLKSSFQKKLQKYMAPKKQRSIAPKNAPSGKGVSQGQIE